MAGKTRWMHDAPSMRNIALSALFAGVLAACGGGGGSDGSAAVANNGNTSANGGAQPNGNTNTPANSGGTTPADTGATPPPDTAATTPVKQSGTVTGKASYDFVPTSTWTDADGELQAKLDYAHIQQRPVRHALVEVLSEDGTKVIGKTSTDDSGVYSIDVPADTRVYVRVTAQGAAGADNAPDYLLKVRDNTAPEYKRSATSAPLYSMRGDAFTTATSGSQADLNAASGWTGSGYGAPRTAAPFAILDQLVSAAQKLRAAAPDVTLPALNAYWSVNNRPASGDASSGNITSSAYVRTPATRGLYILGAENVDTDEYDPSVIVHEFGHYLENVLSRSDSIGGWHGSGDALDMTVAFSEAFGNAFSSMVRDTPVYSDTIGPLQGETGVAKSLDAPSKYSYSIWFDEEAVGNVLYSLYKSPDVGFAPIYQAMLHGQKATPAFTSIFSFATALRPALSDAGKTVLDGLLTKIQVTGGTQLDEWGTATTKGDWTASALDAAIFPIYARLSAATAGTSSATSCTTRAFGGGNKLGNYGYVRLSIPANGMYTLSVTPAVGGPAASSYSLAVYKSGVPNTPILKGAGSGTYSFLAAGDYAAYVVPEANTDLTLAPLDDLTTSCASVALKAGM
jgi:hypothetical protein